MGIPVLAASFHFDACLLTDRKVIGMSVLLQERQQTPQSVSAQAVLHVLIIRRCVCSVTGKATVS